MQLGDQQIKGVNLLAAMELAEGETNMRDQAVMTMRIDVVYPDVRNYVEQISQALVDIAHWYTKEVSKETKKQLSLLEQEHKEMEMLV
jgi:hypothetical protein